MYHGLLMTDSGRSERQILDEAAAYRRSAALLAGVETGLLQALATADRTLPELAGTLGGDPRGLGALANALVALGWLELHEGLYHLPTGLRPFFTEGHERSLLAILRHNARLARRWTGLAESALTGQPVPRTPRNDEEQAAFLAAMDDVARRGAPLLWDHVPLAGRRVLLDVGGGGGRYALEAVRRTPGLEAVVVDLPESESAFSRITAGAAEAVRVRFHAADALEGPLPAGDAALVSSLIHIYGPEDLARLAENLARALRTGALLVLRDYFYEDADHTAPPSTALFELNMLVNTRGGRCYTPTEVEALFSPAGFRDWEIHPLDGRTLALTATLGGTGDAP